MEDKSELVKLNINLIRMEKDNLTELKVEYETETGQTILKLKPENETQYRIAEIQAKIEHKDLYEQILKKENEIHSLEQLLIHKDEVAQAYHKFREDNKEMLELMEKIFGE